jgi:hypothetical protein
MQRSSSRSLEEKMDFEVEEAISMLPYGKLLIVVAERDRLLPCCKQEEVPSAKMANAQEGKK